MNRTIIVTVTIIFYLSAVNAQQRDSFTVYLFLLEDCKITKPTLIKFLIYMGITYVTVSVLSLFFQTRYQAIRQ
jgi:hypothetical protein